jgi:hypothetical protein
LIDINGYFTDQYNAGVSFHAVSAVAYPGATLIAENTSTGAGAVAIQGVMTSTSAGGSSAAVRGINNNNVNNNGVGVWGSHAGAGWGVVGHSQTGLGVVGQVFGSVGTGVYGETASLLNNNAGVWGRDGGGAMPSSLPASAAGVRGEGFYFGVLGLSRANRGVQGMDLDSDGNVEAWGILGYDALITHYGVWSSGPYGSASSALVVEAHPTKADVVFGLRL